MSSIGAQILLALQAQLKTIKVAAGYLNDLKDVVMDQRPPSLNTSVVDLPQIQIMQESEKYQHNLGSSYWSFTDILLYLVAEKAWTDAMMEDLKKDVRTCLFGGSASASGNTGITLGGLLQKIELVDSVADLNMIESNRIYLLRIRLHSHRTTYRD